MEYIIVASKHTVAYTNNQYGRTSTLMQYRLHKTLGGINTGFGICTSSIKLKLWIKIDIPHFVRMNLIDAVSTPMAFCLSLPSIPL